MRLIIVVACLLAFSSTSHAITAAQLAALNGGLGSNFNVFEGANNNVFGRSSSNLFFLGGLIRNGKLDLSGGLPPDLANFSRLSDPRIKFNSAEDFRRALVRNFQGAVNAQGRLFANGAILAQLTDIFGNPRSFFGQLPLDSEALRQLAAKFLYDTKLGAPNDPFAVTEAILAGNNQALADIVRDRFAVDALARRNLSPELQRGQVTIRCQDIVNVMFNETDTVEKEYENLSWQDQCKMVASDALNNVVDINHPPIRAEQFTPNADGTLTITGLNRHFTPRQLGIVFGKQDQVMDFCNSDNPNAFPQITLEQLVRQSYNPTVYNAMKWNVDAIDRNILAECGVNLTVPRAVQPGFGLQGHYFLRNIESTVTDTPGTNTSREVMWFSNAGARRRLSITYDPQSYRQGAQGAGQSVHQAGRVNTAVAGSEGFCGDEYGRRHSFVAAAAKVVGAQGEQVVVQAVDEAPATIAHTKGGAVEAANCVQCHDHGAGIFSSVAGSYTREAVPGTTDISQLGAPGGLLNTDAQAYLGYKQMIGALIPNEKGGTKAIGYDAYRKINKVHRSPERMDVLAGYPVGTVRNLLISRPDIAARMQIDENGNIASGGLLSGGQCQVRTELARMGIVPGGAPATAQVAGGASAAQAGVEGLAANPNGGQSTSSESGSLPRWQSHVAPNL